MQMHQVAYSRPFSPNSGIYSSYYRAEQNWSTPRNLKVRLSRSPATWGPSELTLKASRISVKRS